MPSIKAVKNALSITALATISFGVMGVDSVSASEISFQCTMYDGEPTTITSFKGNEKPFLIWDSGYFVNSGYTDEVRCEEVTARLNDIFTDNNSPFLTYGTINNLPVICTSDVEGGDCSTLVYTLKNYQDPEVVLESILAFDAASIDADDTLRESTSSCPLYIGFKKNGEITGSRACEPKQGFIQNTWNLVTEFFK